mmetsp:Transcript_22404/g.33391  ORF Transcript_22404/g.33391 Transcript_22404/m.33391 type:complete len:280 (-) Transcript_22404:238-1077(-)|eukprot:CAMPEP_0167759524 /NCGR_PEP_ID=MMETSP0110_2-20121227/11074_1 /TAXON_ID=629695 /ORGANISM="Gymnochlora sp., Strain CCMP2014" /LENGTH=279 /DNA_ID=CAMNT_0007645925 /DNA_START=695 /DNA_END=1534 /DNA_ORIENTATION=+
MAVIFLWLLFFPISTRSSGLRTPFLRSRGHLANLQRNFDQVGRKREILARARDPNIPQQIVDAEANASKQRPLRIGGYGLFGVYGLAVILNNLGFIPLEDDMKLTFFDNDGLNLAVGGLAMGLASYFINSELELREENIQRIWDEVQKRGGPQGLKAQEPVPSGFSQAKGKKKKKKNKRSTKGFSDVMASTTTEATLQESKPASSSVEPVFGKPEPEKPKEEGLIDGALNSLQNTFLQANAAAKFQAMEINTALEDKGILPRLNATSTSGTPSEETQEK